MAEFKVYDGIDGEIAALLNAGADTNLAPAVLTTFEGMKTAALYHERYEELKTILDLYSKLIMKDAEDLRVIVERSREIDTTIGNSCTVV